MRSKLLNVCPNLWTRYLIQDDLVGVRGACEGGMNEGVKEAAFKGRRLITSERGTKAVQVLDAGR